MLESAGNEKNDDNYSYQYIVHSSVVKSPSVPQDADGMEPGRGV